MSTLSTAWMMPFAVKRLVITTLAFVMVLSATLTPTGVPSALTVTDLFASAVGATSGLASAISGRDQRP